MAAYTYKEVCHRADFTAMEEQFEGMHGREIDPDPNYDGDYWTVAADLLDAKDARIAELEALLGEAIESIEDWAGYASEYFREKHGLAEELAKFRAALGDP